MSDNSLAPETVVETTPSEPLVPDSAATVAPQETVPQQTEVTEDTTPMTEEEIDAALAIIMGEVPSDTLITEPTFFPNKDEVKKDVDALTAALEEAKASDKQAEDAEKALAEFQKKLAEESAAKEQLEKFVEDVKVQYGKISEVLGTDIADKITAWETDIPLHLYADKMERVYSHPFFGKHVKTLLEWGEVDIPKLLKDALASRTVLPDTTQTPRATTPEPQTQSPSSNLVNRLRSRNMI